MSRGISLHIGVNRINPDHYGTDGALSGCENDAHAMRRIATARGFARTDLLLTESVTSARVISAIQGAARELRDGDFFLLTYAGHGAQVRDTTRDEDDALDETWCLYDRMLIDDELLELWGRFAAGVRICVVSDSCHSGTILRAAVLAGARELAEESGAPSGDLPPAYRVLPEEIAIKTYEDHKSEYRKIKRRTLGRAAVQASVLSLSACQDTQTAADGAANGAFTSALLKVWNGAAYRAPYASFVREIGARLGASQTPRLDRAGTPSPQFEQQVPFTITRTPSNGDATMVTRTHFDPPGAGNDYRAIDEQLDRIKAEVLTRELPSNGTSPEGGAPAEFRVALPWHQFTRMSEQDVYQFLRGEAADTMMKVYLQYRSIPVQREFSGEGRIDCRVDSKGGWGCSVGGSFRF